MDHFGKFTVNAFNLVYCVVITRRPHRYSILEHRSNVNLECTDHDVWIMRHKTLTNKGSTAYFSLRMRETPIILRTVKNMTSPSCSPTPISYMMQKFWRFGHQYGPNCIFFIAHAQNGLITIFCQKSDVTIVFPDPDFL